MSDRLNTFRDMLSLSSKVVLVAGGAGGIGSAVCDSFAALGAKVLLTDIEQDAAERKAEEIRAMGGTAEGFGVVADNKAALAEFVDDLVARHGTIDILFNAIGSGREAPALEYSEEDWDWVFDLNLKTAFFLSKAVARHQVNAGTGGKHIHITSVRSALALAGRGFISYCSSKGAMVLMIRQLAAEWGQYGITVNGIAPTFVRTARVAEYLDDPEFYKPLVARIPLGRIAEPEDVAGMAMFLASPASDYVNGQNLFLDGGLTARQ